METTEFKKGQDIFIYGKLSQISTDSFLVIQIINPQGDLCQIQQIVPLSNGLFLTEPIPLEGRICGLEGNYEIKIFYGDDTKSDEFKVSSSVFKEKTGSEYLDSADSKLSELKRLIERYLPVRSRSAVVEAVYDDDKLVLSGAVQKTLSFREDLFVDIFDQRGNHIDEITLKDTTGQFNEILSKPFEPGMYVAQLQYHDLTVSDYFYVTG